MRYEVQSNLSSTKISINAKGKWSGEVKVYELVPSVAYEKALELAIALEKRIMEKNGEQ